MSLHFTVYAGTVRIGWVEIQRREHWPAPIPPDTVSTYEVRLNDQVMGEVMHRFGDGWPALIIKAMGEIDQSPGHGLAEYSKP